MIDANVVFWAFVILISFFGSNRGWIREVIVSFSMVFAIFAIRQLFTVQVVNDFSDAFTSPMSKWAIRAVPFIVITIFGYLGPTMARGRSESNLRGRFEEGILSLLLGALNGYLLFSSLAWFAAEAGILGRGDWSYGGTILFRPPDKSSWTEAFFIKYAAIAYLHGTTLVFVLILLVLFVLVVVI